MAPAAWNIDACYRRYAPMVYRRCKQLLGDDERAADALQEVFMRLARAQLDVQSPSALLNRMATQVSLNLLREAKGRAQADAARAQTEGAVFAEDLERRIGALRYLDWVLGRELDTTRTMVLLHYLDGMTLEEVAAEVGMSVSGVRFRLRLLKAKLAGLEAP